MTLDKFIELTEGNRITYGHWVSGSCLCPLATIIEQRTALGPITEMVKSARHVFGVSTTTIFDFIVAYDEACEKWDRENPDALDVHRQEAYHDLAQSYALGVGLVDQSWE